MTTPDTNMAPKVIKVAIAVVFLVVLVMVVLSYLGTYRSSKSDADASEETTASIDATSSAAGVEPAASPEGGEEAEGEQSAGTVIVLIDGLNFRTSASKSGDLISGLDEGVKLEYLETADGWYKVRTSDGKVGYVSASEQYTELQE